MTVAARPPRPAWHDHPRFSPGPLRPDHRAVDQDWPRRELVRQRWNSRTPALSSRSAHDGLRFARAGVARSFGFTRRRGLRSGSRRPGDAHVRRALFMCITVLSVMATIGGAADSSAAGGRHPGADPTSQAATGTCLAGRRSSHPGRSAVLLAPGSAPVSAGAAGSAGARVLVMRIYWTGRPPASPDYATMRALDEGHGRLVRAGVTRTAPRDERRHAVAEGGWWRLQLHRPPATPGACPGGRGEERLRHRWLRPVHGGLAAVREHLVRRAARTRHLDPGGQTVPRGARPRARAQPGPPPRQLVDLPSGSNVGSPKVAGAPTRSTATCGTPWG